VKGFILSLRRCEALYYYTGAAEKYPDHGVVPIVYAIRIFDRLISENIDDSYSAF
jgi:hypothetical protein